MNQVISYDRMVAYSIVQEELGDPELINHWPEKRKIDVAFMRSQNSGSVPKLPSLKRSRNEIIGTIH